MCDACRDCQGCAEPSKGGLVCLFGGEGCSSSVLLEAKAWGSLIRGGSARRGWEPGDCKPCTPLRAAPGFAHTSSLALASPGGPASPPKDGALTAGALGAPPQPPNALGVWLGYLGVSLKHFQTHSRCECIRGRIPAAPARPGAVMSGCFSDLSPC